MMSKVLSTPEIGEDETSPPRLKFRHVSYLPKNTARQTLSGLWEVSQPLAAVHLPPVFYCSGQMQKGGVTFRKMGRRQQHRKKVNLVNKYV